MVNETEKVLSAFAQMYFFKELVQDRLQFIEDGSTEKEVADLLLNLGDIIVAIQLKARSESDKTENLEKEIKWLNHKCKDAKKQVKESIIHIRNGKLPAFENERGQYISIDPEAEIIPLVIFMNEDIGNKYDHVLWKHSVDGMDINCLSFLDFQTVCRELLTPIEIVEYLRWRLAFYQENGNVNISIYMGDDDSVLLTKPASGEALVHQFLDEQYGIKHAKEMEDYVMPFQWMLHNLPDRVVEESINDSSYPMILFFSHFDRTEIKAFGERINRALKSAKNGEYTIVGSLRNTLRKYVIFFVSTHDGLSLPMDYLEELANKGGADCDKLIQAFLYWENDEEFRIDYVFRDSSNQYLRQEE